MCKLAINCSTSDKLDKVVSVFNNLFEGTYRTVLVGGAGEPQYLPAPRSDGFAQLFFREDYLSSALHECAHWCVAGKQRRGLLDFGYWYAPDGRTAQQQIEFERVEVKPQALEWIFSRSCGHQFHLSADNLEGDVGASETFKEAVYEQLQQYFRNGLSERAQVFASALSRHFDCQNSLSPSSYSLAELK